MYKITKQTQICLAFGFNHRDVKPHYLRHCPVALDVCVTVCTLFLIMVVTAFASENGEACNKPEFATGRPSPHVQSVVTCDTFPFLCGIDTL